MPEPAAQGVLAFEEGHALDERDRPRAHLLERRAVCGRVVSIANLHLLRSLVTCRACCALLESNGGLWIQQRKGDTPAPPA